MSENSKSVYMYRYNVFSRHFGKIEHYKLFQILEFIESIRQIDDYTANDTKHNKFRFTIA